MDRRPTNGIKKEDLVLWKSPLKTSLFAVYQFTYLIGRCLHSLRQYSRLTAIAVIVIASYFAVKSIDGAHQSIFAAIEKQAKWCLYWIYLGVLSSIGFGTGLHTFLLFLGPHIASVTLAAHECGSVKFPEPPYPDEIECPADDPSGPVSILQIMSKVRVEAFMWGLGTAIGELPPYFMARTARLSGQSLEEVINDPEVESSTWAHLIEKVVEKAGFLGILACASIPNPLFDLAGITCGHFLVPFWTFFGATLLGKAIIKMTLQKMFVIVAFNEHHFETFVSFIRSIPVVGRHLSEPFREFLVKQKASLHRKSLDSSGVVNQSWLQWAFEKFVWAMIAYFIISIINSMAQLYLTRWQKKDKRRN